MFLVSTCGLSSLDIQQKIAIAFIQKVGYEFTGKAD
jgi:hypothetical protein